MFVSLFFIVSCTALHFHICFVLFGTGDRIQDLAPVRQVVETRS